MGQQLLRAIVPLIRLPILTVFIPIDCYAQPNDIPNEEHYN